MIINRFTNKYMYRLIKSKNRYLDLLLHKTIALVPLIIAETDLVR